tara:strand:- start:3036 stop:3446 length:411 start_codon:yes stop_codon:yes gene_type:complete
MKYLLVGMLLTYSNPAIAGPQFSNLKKGDKAPFDGRLLNNEAISKLIVENRLKLEQCDVQIDYQVKKAKAEEKYKYDLLTAKCEAADERLNDIIEIRNDRIKELQKQIKPSRSNWWFVGGFAAGVATSIGIFRTVK